MSKNPWQREGVSVLPKNLANLLPIVGQEQLFRQLANFRDGILNPSSDKLAGFFLLHGGWGTGKSRIGHEVCLEALSEDVEWIVDGNPSRLLEAGLAQGILPLFTRYIQVTNPPLGDNLSADTWIPSVALEALSRLAGLRRGNKAWTSESNQERIVEHTLNALKPKGWDRIKDRLLASLKKTDVHRAARECIDLFKEIGIGSFWIVVDEIEDITDVDLDGIKTDERKPIDQALLLVIPRVIKAEEVRMDYPEFNFLLLCSLAIGDLLKRVKAIERRTERHELRTNAFKDVEALFQHLTDTRPDVAGDFAAYPPRLKAAAFLAANRNFGWFNVIMHHAHENAAAGILEHELIRRFAETAKGAAVFDQDAVGAFHIKRDADYARVQDSVFGILPKSLGDEAEIALRDAQRLLEKRDAGDNGRVFAGQIEVTPPEPHRVLTHMIRCGFRNAGGNTLELPGEARFDLKVVMDSLLAYSTILLPSDRRQNMVLCEDLDEFTAQIRALSPYAEQADEFSQFLHGFLMEESLRTAHRYVGPAFSFLAKFNRLSRGSRTEEGFLRDKARNTRLEEAFQADAKDATKRASLLLQGFANVTDLDRGVVRTSTVGGMKLPTITYSSAMDGLNVGADGEAVLLYATHAAAEEVEQDLQKLAKNAALPVVLILEDQEARAEELRNRITRTVPRIAPFVSVHSFPRQIGDCLVRMGLMGTAFAPEDFKTGHFNAAIMRARDLIRGTLDTWMQTMVEGQGLVLRPVFYGSKVNDEDVLAFAKGYAAMLSGKTYQDAIQKTSGVLDDDAEIDRFKKMADRQLDVPPKYKDDEGRCPLLSFIYQDEGGIKAAVPRAAVAMMQRCSTVYVSAAVLEKSFLYELPRKADVKPGEVVRHLVSVLAHLGLLNKKGNEVKVVSTLLLEEEVKAASDWLTGRYEDGAKAIRAIHRAEGDRLLDVRGKEAAQWLKEARNRLENLHLEFISKSWDQLGRESADGRPEFEQGVCVALDIVRKVKAAVEKVYVPEAERGFVYSLDALRDYESRSSSSSYPLWKRLKVLQGFYQELDQKRRHLVRFVDETLKRLVDPVPLLPSGDKSFPTQALSRPLDMFKDELQFSAEKPNRTIMAGGSSLNVITVGYKISDNRYQEALDRIQVIEAQLTQPGKLVSTFEQLLASWDTMRRDLVGVQGLIRKLDAFLADAAEGVRSDLGVDEINEKFEELDRQLNQGGIREATDAREDAATQPLELIDGLKSDMDKLVGKPQALAERLTDAERSILVTLEERYQRKYADLVSACARIRKVLGRDLPTWPQERAETYGKTLARFEGAVAVMQKDGEAYFEDVSGTTSFEDYKALCRMLNEGKSVDWESPEFDRHVGALKQKRLLELRLV